MKFQQTEAAKALDRVGGALLHNEATALEQDDSHMKVALLLNTQVNRAKASKNVGQGASVFGEDKDDKDEEGNPPASSILRFEKKTSRSQVAIDQGTTRSEHKRKDSKDSRKPDWLC
jgi:hypothetical protein